MDKNRIDKIKILAALHDGVIAPEDIRQDHRYRFQEVAPGVFEYKGKTFSEKEMAAFFKDAHERIDKMRMLLGQDIQESVIGFVFRLPDNIPEVIQPVKEEGLQQLPAPTEEKEETFTEVELTKQEAPGEPVKPEIIKDPKEKQKRFNLLGEIIEEEEKDRERTRKMNEFKHINNGL